MNLVTYPDQLFEQYTYNANNQMETVIDRNGTTLVTNHYDPNGRVYRQDLADTGIFNFSYTLDGNNVSRTDVTDPDNHIRRVTYDTHGYKATVIRALGTPQEQTTTFERDATSGLLTALVDPLNHRTEFVRDYMNGSVIQRTDLVGTAGATVQKYSYTADFNQLASYTDARGQTTTFGYDTLGNLLSVTDPLAHQVTFTHNAAGQLLSRTNGVGAQSTFGYNTAGDLVSVAVPLHRSLSIGRDNFGRSSGVTDPMGIPTGVTYDTMGRVHTVTDRLNKTTTIEYFPNGNVHTVTDPNTGETQFGYDPLGRPNSRVDALGKEESWTYDLAGNLHTYTDRKQQTTTYQYNALDRLSLVTFSDSSTVTPTFDAVGRLTQVVDSVSGTISRNYDDINRTLQEITAQGTVTVSYAYDAAGRRTTMTAASQAPVAYGYDDANRLMSIQQGSENVTFGYDSANRRTSLTLPNGIIATYAYDMANRLTSLSYVKDANALAVLSYGYDADGQRVSKGGGFGADFAPTPTTGTSIFNLNNRETLWNGFTLGYDDNGDPTTNPAANQTYTFDVRHRLTQIQQGGSTLATFQYDTFGRRTSKTVNGTTTSFLYDGLNPVQEAQGATTSSILTGAGIDERFARDDAAGRRYFLTDALGSTVALTDNLGTVQQTYGYEPYGEVASTGGSNNPYQYTGRENDGTGLYFYRARYYSPSLKRFISEDPMGLAAGLNGYAYVGGDPIDLRDPSGLLPAIPQNLLNMVTGAGDGVMNALSFGQGDLAGVRDFFGIDGGVDPCAGYYQGGRFAGNVWGIGTLWAFGLNGGSESIFWAGRGAEATARTLGGTTIGDTIIGAALNGFGVEDRLVWSLASATFAANADGAAVAVVTYVSPESIWVLEQSILTARGVPIFFY